jgi:hypothetical protein
LYSRLHLSTSIFILILKHNLDLEPVHQAPVVEHEFVACEASPDSAISMKNTVRFIISFDIGYRLIQEFHGSNTRPASLKSRVPILQIIFPLCNYLSARLFSALKNPTSVEITLTSVLSLRRGDYSWLFPETCEKCAIVIRNSFGDGKVGTNKSKEKFLQDVLRLLYEQQERISKLEQGLNKLRKTDKAQEIPAHIQEILPNEPHNLSMN